MAQTYQERLTELLARLFEKGYNATPDDIAAWIDGSSDGYQPVKEVLAAINALNAEMIGFVPGGDLKYFGGEVKGMYEERADLRERFGVES